MPLIEKKNINGRVSFVNAVNKIEIIKNGK